MIYGMRKHIKRRHQFLKEQVGKKNVKDWVLQLDGILTKPLKQVIFESLEGLMRIGNLQNLN